MSEQGFEKVIETEFSGDIRDALITLGKNPWENTFYLKFYFSICKNVARCFFLNYFLYVYIFYTVSSNKNPLVHYVKRLRETVENDINTFSRLVVERCEVRKHQTKLLSVSFFCLFHHSLS